MTERYVIVGLGNPGKEYEQTKHNVGFWTLDELARRHQITVSKTERKALTGDGMIGDKRVLLVKPQTYMNLSGESVRGLMDFYKIPPEALIVAHDDLDLPLGTLRLRKEGSHGGQNGVRSIIQHLGTQTFCRAKLGIGRPPGKMPPAAYVLQPFKGDDEIIMRQLVDRAANAVELWLCEGIDSAMNRYNGSVL